MATEYNGGAILAMKGKNCVAVASDKRLGQQALTVSTEFPKFFPIHDHLQLGLVGLATDVQSLVEKFEFKINMFKLNEERAITPKAFAHLVSSTLYEKRWSPWYIEPIIAGLDENRNPFICSADLIGCLNFADDFVVAGTCTDGLFGMCETLYRPDLEPEDLFETVSQAMVNALDRNALSGWGAEVKIM